MKILSGLSSQAVPELDQLLAARFLFLTPGVWLFGQQSISQFSSALREITWFSLKVSTLILLMSNEPLAALLPVLVGRVSLFPAYCPRPPGSPDLSEVSFFFSSTLS